MKDRRSDKQRANNGHQKACSRSLGQSAAVLVARHSERPSIARLPVLNYASGVVGSPLHLAAELFKSMTGVHITHVPYKGGVPAVSAVVTGETQVIFGSITAAMPHVKAGRLRGLAVTSAQRSVLLPELPTVADTVSGYEATNWYGVLGPAGMPRPVVLKLNSELLKVLQNPDIRNRMMLNQGIEPLGSTPEAFSS